MSLRFNEEVRDDRARDLESQGLNGLKRVFVTLAPAVNPTHALLDLEFHNGVALDGLPGSIPHAVTVDGRPLTEIVTIRGGTRRIGGENPGQVQVAAYLGQTENTLQFQVSPIGDYSTYTVAVMFDDGAGSTLIDPLFRSLPFKFRPGCFNLNCTAPSRENPPAAARPLLDYLARDFHSFKHVLINALAERVPDWEPTSEADLDQVIVDLLAADGDELCDFQDRVMSEAYLGTARKRVSLARHARLMDYHIHQGNQAGTWIALEVSADQTIPAGFGVWTGDDWTKSDAVIFATTAAQACFVQLNQIELYTWGGAVIALEAGSTEADLALPAGLNPAVEADAEAFRDLVLSADVHHLVLEEKLNPETGTVNGLDVTKRQILRLLDDADTEPAAETVFDPFANQWCVRVRWKAEDRLQRRYCFITACPNVPPAEGVSSFHGNLVFATHGRPHQTTFRPPGSDLAASDDAVFVRLDEAYWETTRWGVVCTLPQGPLAYLDTPPGGETPPRSTLALSVSGFADPWEEQTDLIESQGDDEHFIVETDELGISRIRFGNGTNGMALDPEAVVTCRHQVGRGSSGNIGPDSLTGWDAAFLDITRVWNPLDVVNGRDAEPAAELLRRVPEAYRSRQRRAITLADYVDQSEQLPGVAHAYARYAWTGSWRTVVVSIDPAGTTQLDEELRREIERRLDAVRLIGEDLEVRPAQYVPLDIQVRLCADPDYWPEDLEAELELEFSDGYTADGRPGFFHPDAWTFGQPLYSSQIIGRALAITGIGRVLSVSIRRWDASTGPTTSTVVIDPDDLPLAEVDVLTVAPFEIIQVENDPDHLEHGRILFEIVGGRQ